MISVRMNNERHVGLEVQIDVLEHGGSRVYIKAQTVAAYAGVLRCHVVAEAMVAKYLVLRSRDVSCLGAGANRRYPGFESLVVDSENAFLRFARFSEHK